MKWKSLCIFMVAIICCLPTMASDVGHGGGGYVCTDPDGSVHVRLVDLEEANLRQFMGYSPIPRTNEPLENQVATAVKRLSLVDYAFAQKVEGELRFIQDHYTDVPKGWTINKPTDVDADLAPTECPLDGVATYWDEWKVLWIKMKYFNHMFSETDKAALFMHESIYKVFRGNPWNDKDSVRTRKIVGILFSTERDFQRDLTLLKSLLN